jgi:hypothetical protein
VLAPRFNTASNDQRLRYHLFGGSGEISVLEQLLAPKTSRSLREKATYNGHTTTNPLASLSQLIGACESMEATYCMGTDVDVCRMFDQYLYKVSNDFVSSLIMCEIFRVVWSPVVVCGL